MEETELYLPRLKKLLGIPDEDSSKDDRLKFVLDAIIQGIMTYCNIVIIPTSHEHVVLLIAEDYYRAKYPTEFEQTPQTVSSVKRGDVQTNFGTAKAAVTAGTGSTFVQGYAAQLHAIRRMRW